MAILSAESVMAMKKFYSGLLLLTLTFAVPAGEAVACGDKFLVIGRGAGRVQKARHPASILLVLRENAKLAAVAREMNLEATLKRAGHTVETLTAPAPLSEWLATRRYDFILTSLEAAPAAVRDAAATAPAPAVIPIAMKTEAPARLAVEKRYGLVIQAPTKSLSYLSAIDAEMGRRRNSASRP